MAALSTPSGGEELTGKGTGSKFADLQAKQHLDWTGRPRVGVQELGGVVPGWPGVREQLEPSGRSVGRRLGPGRPPPSYPGAPVVAEPHVSVRTLPPDETHEPPYLGGSGDGGRDV